MSRLGQIAQYAPPVVVGGVGGSGTRLVAECLKEAGFYVGTDLNEANDNLWFTLLFKRIGVLSASEEEFDSLVEIFCNAMAGNGAFSSKNKELIKVIASEDGVPHSENWRRKRVETLLAVNTGSENIEKWGWKEPNTHIVLQRLIERIPRMKYIHVARNGLDMAYSGNQNQLRMWGRYFLNEEIDVNPYYSLRYWCAIHKRVIHIGESMKENFLFINYDDLCVNQVSGINKLLDFLGVNSDTLVQKLVALVRQPESTGRFRESGITMFADEDVEYVRSLGFDVEGG